MKIWVALLAAFSLCGAALAATPQEPPTKAAASAAPTFSNANVLLLELYLDQSTLADSFYAYERGNDVLLPLGELTRLLTLGITVDASSRVASGFILTEDRGFRLDLGAGTITLKDGTVPFNAQQVQWIDEDLYVSSKLLARWLPLDFKLSLPTLTLEVLPREKLPLQARLERERLAKGLGKRGGAAGERGFAVAPNDYALVSMPVVDQTLGINASRSNGQGSSSVAYSAFVTGDLLGTEMSAYISSTNTKTTPVVRMTLSRHDPGGGLLGPLQAHSVMAGNIGLPALDNTLRGGGGDGLLVSNRALSQPSSFGLHTLRGDLQPGWDVTLYFNDALIGFQQSRADGLYEFADQALVFGENEFRLVFSGPLGQTRVERQVFLLDQTLTKPGEFYYSAGGSRGIDGATRHTLQFDLGLADKLAMVGGLVSLPTPGGVTNADTPLAQYQNLGLRTSLGGALLTADLVHAGNGGNLTNLGLRTRLRKMAVNLTHTVLNDFVSDFFAPSADPLKTRDKLRLSGSVPVGEKTRLPVGLDVSRDVTLAGLVSQDVAARLSANVFSTSFTNSMNWHSDAYSQTAAGALQVSTRVAGFGVSGQLAYLVKPESQLSSLALSGNKEIGVNQRLTVDLLRAFDSGVTSVGGGWTRNYGSFGLSVSGRMSSTGERAVGLQLFMSLGRDPRGNRVVADWQPMAGSGAVSARAFLDANQNGVFETGEEAIENAGFVFNSGSRPAARTGADGQAYLSRLTPHQYTDIELDASTLEDPQWVPLVPGMRILPRPGKTQVLDFPVVMTGEVDGVVYLLDKEKKRGIGAADVELVDASGNVVARVTSSSDGYYIVQAVRPGRYQARIAPAQLAKLGLLSDKEIALEIKADGSFVNGLDFTVRRKTAN
ncbi:collagen binding domain-containing protein [Rhodoferax sp. PAMC 29310]|uniref:MSCRAMM family protein n=1 Tax=Rhodoferax sp. PAMC 29310 TaxID=2822760 RepID=UPI001B339E42|nr:carboxypeptidase-like regulatory domain-containing protein [Rhodoferax sp. PAMC 29310]